jgi:ATP-dependent Clp protease ATP-binding subunit ClpC
MTSNVGAELIKRQTALGFGAASGHGSYEAMRDKILEESKRVFNPEFLNRLDDIIVFRQLERNELVKIVDLEVAKVIGRIRAKDIKVHLDATAVDFLIDKGYDPIYGARPMRRAVEKYLEDPVAEELLRGNIKPGDTLDVHAAGERLAFNLAQPEKGEPVTGNPP